MQLHRETVRESEREFAREVGLYIVCPGVSHGICLHSAQSLVVHLHVLCVCTNSSPYRICYAHRTMVRRSPGRLDSKRSGTSLCQTHTRSSRSSPASLAACRRVRTVVRLSPCVMHCAMCINQCTLKYIDPLHHSPTCSSTHWLASPVRALHITVCTPPYPMRGLLIKIWGDKDPVSLSVFNANYSQTRSKFACICTVVARTAVLTSPCIHVLLCCMTNSTC